jgi:hypothetical protein
MDNLENQIISNLQYQIDILQKDNLNYLYTISDLENNIDNLKNEIIQKNKEIDKLNDTIKLKEEQNMLNKLDSTQSIESNTPTGLLGTKLDLVRNSSIFRKVFGIK